MENGFKELLPPKLKGFIIKRQAKFTHDQAKHLYFYIPTRKLEADMMVDALNRLDQTGALVEHILGDRAKLEHHANRGHAQSDSHAQAYPMEAETITSTESKHYHNHEAASDTVSDQLDWDPEKIDDDGFPLVDENGSTLVPIPRLDEDEASSLTAWAQGYWEVRKTFAIQSQDVVITNPRQAGSRKSSEKPCSRRHHRDETETSAHHSETKARDHSTERVTSAELRKRTRCYRCRQLGCMAREW